MSSSATLLFFIIEENIWIMYSSVELWGLMLYSAIGFTVELNVKTVSSLHTENCVVWLEMPMLLLLPFVELVLRVSKSVVRILTVTRFWSVLSSSNAPFVMAGWLLVGSWVVIVVWLNCIVLAEAVDNWFISVVMLVLKLSSVVDSECWGLLLVVLIGYSVVLVLMEVEQFDADGDGLMLEGSLFNAFCCRATADPNANPPYKGYLNRLLLLLILLASGRLKESNNKWQMGTTNSKAKLLKSITAIYSSDVRYFEINETLKSPSSTYLTYFKNYIPWFLWVGAPLLPDLFEWTGGSHLEVTAGWWCV